MSMSGRDPDAPQLVDRVLRGLGLQLARVADVGDEREVDEHAAPAPDVDGELADRLEEGQRLDVADGAADLGDHEVDVAGLGDQRDPLLDLVGDVRHHLHGAAEVVAAALAADDGVVDAAGGDVGGAAGVGVGEALVVAEVEVGLGAVLGDEHLAVLVGRHRAGVDVDVGVELLQADGQTARDEQPADRGCGDALAERGDDAAGHEDEPGLAGRLRVAVGVVQAHEGLPKESSWRSPGVRSTSAEIDRELPIERDSCEQHERHELAGARQREHQPQPRERPEQVRAGVTEHRPLAQVIDAGDERGAANRPSAHSGRRSALPIARPAPSSTNALVARPGRRSSRLKALVASTSTASCQQPAPVGEPQVAHRKQRQAERADGLERAGGELAP